MAFMFAAGISTQVYTFTHRTILPAFMQIPSPSMGLFVDEGRHSGCRSLLGATLLAGDQERDES